MFGYPSQQNDAELAVRTGLKLRPRCGAASASDVALQVRVGIASALLSAIFLE
jgi:hypothetical protein